MPVLARRATPPEGLITVKQQVGSGTASSGSTLSIPISTVTPGNLVAMIIAAEPHSGLTLSVTDSASQSWTAGPSAVFYSAAFGKIQGFYFANSAAITTVQANCSASTGGISAVFWEVSGIAASNPLDLSVSNAAGTTGTTSPSATWSGSLATPSEIALGAIGFPANTATMTVTSGEGWSSALEETGLGTYDTRMYAVNQILNSAVTSLTLAGTISSSTNWGDIFMSFKG